MAVTPPLLQEDAGGARPHSSLRCFGNRWQQPYEMALAESQVC
jgi:hypothetical protein